jgi:hypothetical protein
LYRILSVSGTTATMDRSVGTANSTGGHGNLGGAFATIDKATSNMKVGGQDTYVKGATYQITGSISNPILTAGTSLSRIIAYASTRGDNGQATIQVNASSVTVMTGDASTDTSGIAFENIIFDGNSQTSSNGVNYGSTLYCVLVFINCVFKNFTGQYCIQPNAGALVVQSCEFANNAFTTNFSGCILGRTGSGAGVLGGGRTCTVSDSYFSGNSISSTNNAAAIWGQNMALSVQHCIFYNNTGTNMDALNVKNAMAVNISNNALHSSSRHGINIDSAAGAVVPMIQNNIITSNGGWGIIGNCSPAPTIGTINHNAYYNNTSGDKTGFTAGAGEVTLTGLPYMNAPTNFALNAIAGQGLACRGKATPGTLGVSSVVGTGALDIGPLQHGTASGAYTFMS